MNPKTLLRLLTPLALLAAGALVSAQVQLPSAPQKAAGGSISPVFEGWYDNADGTHSFLVGYYSRNTAAEVDVPIGPNNHFEPGNVDMGQPTHFLPSRHYGMFAVTMPKEFGKTQRVTWVLNVNGGSYSIPFHMHPDYNISPFKSSEQSVSGGYNMPPVLRFEGAAQFQGPTNPLAAAVARTATVGVPMPLNFLADDDASYSTNTGALYSKAPPPVTLLLSKYRGPGDVTLSDKNLKLETLKGGQLEQPYSGKASTTVSFSKPGEYFLHVTASDYSGVGGGGSGCCWTNALVRVTVKEAGAVTTGGQ